ncbi:MAG TPA: response regulator transcription factor [Vicinamibacterales bacterium]|jgi:DNA-binding NarL/FixJ family response regulator
MRVVLIGSAGGRARLRAQLEGSGIQITAETATIADARAGSYDADAFLVAHTNGRAEPIVHDADRIPPEALTPRELEVLALLAEGLPNKSIARRLDISDQTVKFHVASIYGKLGAANRTDAVRRAVRRGLVVL